MKECALTQDVSIKSALKCLYWQSSMSFMEVFFDNLVQFFTWCVWFVFLIQNLCLPLVVRFLISEFFEKSDFCTPVQLYLH